LPHGIPSHDTFRWVFCLLAIKGNHPVNFGQVSSYLDAAADESWKWVDYAEEEAAYSHGRYEQRRCWQSG